MDTVTVGAAVELARALGAPAGGVELSGDRLVVRGPAGSWRVEPLPAWGAVTFGPGYRVYTARPEVTDDPTVRGLAELPDGRVVALDDAGTIRLLASTGVVGPLALAHLAALFADREETPRRVLEARLESAESPGTAAVVSLRTLRLDYPEDPDLAPRRVAERWVVRVRRADVTWRRTRDDEPPPVADG